MSTPDKATIDALAAAAQECIVDSQHFDTLDSYRVVRALNAIAYSLLAIRLELASIADNTSEDKDIELELDEDFPTVNEWDVTDQDDERERGR